MKNKTTLLILTLFFVLGTAYSQITFTGKPRYDVVVKRAGTYLGTIQLELFPNIAPLHVRNFDSLVTEHFFDTTAFHRVLPGFVIQGGDPNTRHGAMNTWGSGQPGQPTVDAEFSVAKHVRGMVSAARTNNINSATSQFFICVANAPVLNGQYSLYGKVTSGMKWVDTIVNTPRYPAPNTYTDIPLQKMEMFITRNGSNDSIPQSPLLMAPINGTVGVNSTIVPFKWQAVNDAVIYHIEIARDSLFEDTVLTKNVAATLPNSTVFFNAASVFEDNTAYFWRVNVNNGGHFSDYSTVWKFHTKGEATGIAANRATEPVRVFPNPATGKFMFSNIEKGSKIEIFDVTGKMVYETIAADNPVLIDLTRKDKGEYFYKVSNGKTQFRKGKLILQ